MSETIRQILTEHKEPELVVHDTVESIFYKHWNLEGDLSFDDLMECEAGFDEGDGGNMQMRDLLEMTRENGFWAYSDFKNHAIHVWFPKAMDFESVLMVMGHEVGHLLEKHGDKPTEHQEMEAEADEYGVASVFAYRLAQRIFSTFTK